MASFNWTGSNKAIPGSVNFVENNLNVDRRNDYNAFLTTTTPAFRRAHNASAEADDLSSQDPLPRAFYAILIIAVIIIESIALAALVEKLYEKYLQRLAEKHRAEKIIEQLKHPKKPEQEMVREVRTRFRQNAQARRSTINALEHNQQRPERAEDQTDLPQIHPLGADSDDGAGPSNSEEDQKTTTNASQDDANERRTRYLVEEARQKAQKMQERFSYPQRVVLEDDEASIGLDLSPTKKAAKTNNKKAPIAPKQNPSNVRQRPSAIQTTVNELSVHHPTSKNSTKTNKSTNRKVEKK